MEATFFASMFLLYERRKMYSYNLEFLSQEGVSIGFQPLDGCVDSIQIVYKDPTLSRFVNISFNKSQMKLFYHQLGELIEELERNQDIRSWDCSDPNGWSSDPSIEGS